MTAPEYLAGEVHAQLGGAVLPIDVEDAAYTFGVEEIRLTNMSGDGKLESVGGRGCIFVDASARRTRQRFTVAHELGHWLLADPEQEFIAYRNRPHSSTLEEQFCDRFAAALLMPAAVLERRYGGVPESITVAKDLASVADVSLTAAFLRLRHVLGWRSVLMQWTRRAPFDWQLSSRIGLRRDVRIGAVAGTVDHLETVRRNGRPALAADIHTVPLRLGSRVVSIDVEVSPSAASVLWRVDLSDLPRGSRSPRPARRDPIQLRFF